MLNTPFLTPMAFTVIVTIRLSYQAMSHECSRMGCINTVEDLVTNFHCDRQSNISDVDFHFQPFVREGTILAVHYKVADKSSTQLMKTEGNTSSEDRCGPADTSNCRIFFIYSNPIFFAVLPRLFYSLSFPRQLTRLHEYATRETQNYYWKPLPFCSYQHIHSILQDFSERVSYILKVNDCFDLLFIGFYRRSAIATNVFPKLLTI